MKRRTFAEASRIAWRRGQWADVAAFLRGEARTRKVGPGMHEPEDGTSCATEFIQSGRTARGAECPRLDELDRGWGRHR